uniref:Phycocyanin PC645 alpha-3 subunit n=1 Tax=Chroomonas sp. (strain CCMP270) TaxID=354589 RepID=PHEA3_CHRS2|nr:RecName: Full=Phycocyanin PC645 alpha-3 subunit [Chroomonas sp. CCMP270]AGY96988.1 phycocyanin645 alpha subunit [Chroomonas sp. CCMP270]
MIAKTAVALALVASAVALRPTMSLSANRREVVAGAGAAAVVAPMLRPAEANAVYTRGTSLSAPVITIFDARGCTDHANKEYKGDWSGRAEDDECCVKIQMQKISVAEDVARLVRLECLNELKSK